MPKTTEGLLKTYPGRGGYVAFCEALPGSIWSLEEYLFVVMFISTRFENGLAKLTYVVLRGEDRYYCDSCIPSMWQGPPDDIVRLLSKEYVQIA